MMQRQAGAQAAKRCPAAGGSGSFGGIASERALGNGHCPGQVWPGDRITLRSDNGLLFTSRHYTRMVHQYVLRQEFILPRTPQQNSLADRLFGTVKEQCPWEHNFQSLDEARRTPGTWFRHYNEHRPYQAQRMKALRVVYQQLAA